MRSMKQSLSVFFFFLSNDLLVTAGFTKTCPLETGNPVPLEYDAVTGEFSLMHSSLEESGQTNNEEVRQLTKTVKVQNAGSVQKRRLRATNEVAKPVYMARPCPCSDSEEFYCLVEGLKGSVHDTCGVTLSTYFTIFGNNTSSVHSSAVAKVECFKLEKDTMFIRNAWPVVVFWYGALFIFLVATDNGKNVRQYVISMICPKCRINERRLDGIMQSEIEHRERIRVATIRAAMLADGPGRYLLRTRGMRVPNNDGLTNGGDQAMRRWIAHAESLGILFTPRPTELVLKTKKFNAKQERTTREVSRMGKADEGSFDRDVPLTPTKETVQNIAGTPETVATCEENIDDYPLSTMTEEGGETEQAKGNFVEEDESFDCTICLAPVEDGNTVGVLSCSHIFHADCLSQWIQRRNVCPLCQTTEIACTRVVEEQHQEEVGGGAPPSSDAVESASARQVASSSPIARPQRLQLQSSNLRRQRRRSRQNDLYVFP